MSLFYKICFFQSMLFFSNNALLYKEYMFSFFYKNSHSNVSYVPFIDLKLYIVFILNMQFIFKSKLFLEYNKESSTEVMQLHLKLIHFEKKMYIYFV